MKVTVSDTKYVVPAVKVDVAPTLALPDANALGGRRLPGEATGEPE